jgi:hypothetical protein
LNQLRRLSQFAFRYKRWIPIHAVMYFLHSFASTCQFVLVFTFCWLWEFERLKAIASLLHSISIRNACSLSLWY